MPLLDRVKRAWDALLTGKGYRPTGIEGLGMTSISRFGAGPARNVAAWQRMYGRHPLLYTVVHRIAMDSGAVEWKAYQRDPKDPKQRTELPYDHPVLEMLEEPNPWHTGEDLRQLGQTYMELAGEEFALIIRDGQDEPKQLWPIPPSWVIRTPGPDRPGYQMSFLGETDLVDPRNVLWSTEPNPDNPYGRGLGSAGAVDDEIEQYENTAKFLNSFFRNMARPDVVVGVPDADTDQLERMETDWVQHHGGLHNAWRPRFLNADVRVQVLSKSMQEMDLVNVSKGMRDTVYQLWNVPPEVLGIVENSNRATADAAMYIYGMLVLTPRLRRRRGAFNRRLVPLFSGTRGALLDFDSPVRETSEFLMRRACELFTRGISTRDEARVPCGLKPLGGELGEQILQPVNVVALDREGNTLVVGPNQSQERALQQALHVAGRNGKVAAS